VVRRDPWCKGVAVGRNVKTASKRAMLRLGGWLRSKFENFLLQKAHKVAKAQKDLDHSKNSDA
jgi:hypothetical protein